MKNILLVFYILIVSFSIIPESISGTLYSETGEVVPDATLVLLEYDFISLSDESGGFRFDDTGTGALTLLIIAPGMIETEIIVSSPSENLKLIVTPEVIEMETIVIRADPEEAATVAGEGVTSEELERLPVRSDPFKALPQESGILTEIFTIGNVRQGGAPEVDADGNAVMSAISIPEGRLSFNQKQEVSVYGGESDWNNYYYDYIRLPINTHTFGYPEPDAVVPVEAVDSIDIYKGAYPVEFGPGIGGLFTMKPAELTDEFELTLTPSVMDISALTSCKFSDDLGIILSVNQSILDYTVVPLITSLAAIDSEEDLVEGDNPTSITYGDFLLSLSWIPPNNSFSLDLLGFYDAWAFDLNFDESFLKSNYGPWFLAGGAKWISSFSPDFSNSIYGFGSYYNDEGVFDLHLEGEEIAGTTNYETSWKSMVNSIQFGDEILWDFSDQMSLLWGINGRFSDLNSDYSDETLTSDPDGNILNFYEHDIPFEDSLFAAYTYAKIVGEGENLDYQAGTGLLWYPESGTLRPSCEAEVIYSLDFLILAFTSGWSPGVIDEFSYINRRLDELYYELETETSLDNPPMAVSFAGQVIYTPDKLNSFNFTPYFSWYYELSGISMSTSYTDLDDSFVSLNPSRGYSTGFDLKWSREWGEYWALDISYGFSNTRYDTDELGWTSPNTEVRHALKSSALFDKEGWHCGLNFLLYSGIPFTPDVVQDGDSGNEVVQGEYNSAVEYIPVYELTANFSYQWSFEKFDLSLFINSSDLIDGLNIVNNGLKPELSDTPGASTASFTSRDYEFSYTWTDLLMSVLTSEIGLSFSL
ncbi:MAG: TonB-dependent receptor [Spirochaetales bacterium]|nr:TonB-dependent receptor [Spirochaetales bacterium]